MSIWWWRKRGHGGGRGVALDDRMRAKRKQSGCYGVEEVEGGGGWDRTEQIFVRVRISGFVIRLIKSGEND